MYSLQDINALNTTGTDPLLKAKLDKLKNILRVAFLTREDDVGERCTNIFRVLAATMDMLSKEQQLPMSTIPESLLINPFSTAGSITAEKYKKASFLPVTNAGEGRNVLLATLFFGFASSGLSFALSRTTTDPEFSKIMLGMSITLLSVCAFVGTVFAWYASLDRALKKVVEAIADRVIQLRTTPADKVQNKDITLSIKEPEGREVVAPTPISQRVQTACNAVSLLLYQLACCGKPKPTAYQQLEQAAEQAPAPDQYIDLQAPDNSLNIISPNRPR